MARFVKTEEGYTYIESILPELPESLSINAEEFNLISLQGYRILNLVCKNNCYVGVATDSTTYVSIITSTDLINWNIYKTDLRFNSYGIKAYEPQYLNNTWAVCLSSTSYRYCFVYYSTDAVNWTSSLSANSIYYNNISSAEYPSIFNVVGEYFCICSPLSRLTKSESEHCYAYISKDAITWTKISFSGFPSAGVVYADGKYYIWTIEFTGSTSTSTLRNIALQWTNDFVTYNYIGKCDIALATCGNMTKLGNKYVFGKDCYVYDGEAKLTNNWIIYNPHNTTTFYYLSNCYDVVLNDDSTYTGACSNGIKRYNNSFSEISSPIIGSTFKSIYKDSNITIVYGYSQIAYSHDGINYTICAFTDSVYEEVTSENNLNNLVKSNGIYYIPISYYSNKYLYSYNGEDWSLGILDRPTTSHIHLRLLDLNNILYAISGVDGLQEQKLRLVQNSTDNTQQVAGAIRPYLDIENSISSAINSAEEYTDSSIQENNLDDSGHLVAPDFTGLQPIKTVEFDISDTAYHPIVAFDNENIVPDVPFNKLYAFRVTVTSTVDARISATTDAVINFVNPYGTPYTSIVNYLKDTVASYTGIKYFRYVWPTAANVNNKTNAPYYGIEISQHNATKRHYVIEFFKYSEGTIFYDKSTTSIYVNSTYNGSGTNTVYTYRGLISSGYTYLYATSAGASTYVGGYFNRYIGSSTTGKTGEELPANTMIFLGEDWKMHPVTNTTVAINTDGGISVILNALNTNTAYNYSYYRQRCHLTTLVTATPHDTFSAQDNMYLRCTIGEDGKIYSDNYLTRTMSAGYTYIYVGEYNTSASISFDTIGKMFITVNDDNTITRLNGAVIGDENKYKLATTDEVSSMIDSVFN